MTDTQTSKCHCGEVSLSFPREASFKFSCHCGSCQKLVSGGRLLGFGIPSNSISIEGEVATYDYKGGSGENITLSFCPKCSTQLFGKPDAIEDVIVVRSNLLEDPSSFEPDQFVFTENACSWDNIGS